MPKTEARIFTAHVPLPLADRVDRMAEQLERSRSWIMKQALLAWVTQEEERERQAALEAGYRAMAADKEREEEASGWCEALIGDGADATW